MRCDVRLKIRRNCDQGTKMKILYAVIGTIIFGAQAYAAPTILTAEQWRADLNKIDEVIRTTHPRPFAHGHEDEYRASIKALKRDIDQLTDKEIIIRMAGVVATINDGHTRLSIPLQNIDTGVTIAHSSDPQPNDPRLAFSRLPIKFGNFTDGVFVTDAIPRFAEYIGWRLDRIGALSAAEAMAKAKTIAYADNDHFAQLLAADRLSLPDALSALGVTETPDQTNILLSNSSGETVMLTLSPVAGADITWQTAFDADTDLLRIKNPDQIFWSQYLPREGAVYAQIDEIADSETERFAQFVAGIVSEAERRNAKLIIDLRNNFGGSGDLNRTLVLAIIQNDELNQYGRTFLLIGRRTFSAAQLLSNTLETYSRVLFVGEPTGARPDHFGDSKKSQLENSGLTLRVSSLHWSSFFPDDQRDALNPDLPAPWTFTAYFSREDPALEAASDFDGDLQTLLRGAFERDDQYQVGRYLLNARLFPDTSDQSVAATLIAVSNDFLNDGNTDLAKLALRYGLFFHPDDNALKAAFEALQGDSNEE